MQAFKRILKHLLALFIISIPLLVLYYKEPWILPRIIVTGQSLYNKTKSSILFYLNKEYTAPYLIETTWSIPGTVHIIPNFNFDLWGKSIKNYFQILFSYQNFLSWTLRTSDGLIALCRILMIGICLFLLLYLFFQAYFDENEFDYTRKSKPLQLYLKLKEGPIKKIKTWIINYVRWFRSSIYFSALITILIFNFALPFLVIDLISEYFYFFTSFDFVSLLDTISSVIITIYQGIAFFPLIIKILILLVVIRILTMLRARRLIEGKLIPRDEKMVNNDTGVFTLILGKMRGGKTTLATSMARIMNTIYHKNAYENMTRVSLMFPDFPYIALEKEIIRLAKKRRIVNMEQAAKYVMNIYKAGSNKPFVLFDYDVNKQKTFFFDGASSISLEDALIIYAESYWIYFHDGNLIASNFPIRTDDIKLDNGHLILWDYDYFRRKNKTELWKHSSLSHILVFDSLRMGKKIDSKNIYKDTAGPMVAVSTEFGKEYGNMVTNLAYDPKDDKANPKNDLLDYSLKLGGHMANIWHTNFFKFIADEQRSGSLSANLVDVAQSIFTADKKNQKEKCALHLFVYEPLILDWIISLRERFYTKYRFAREDSTLLFYLLNRLANYAYAIESFVYMRYGYKQINLPRCTCDSTGNIKEGDMEKFYIINFIDYADRFESACMKDFLNQYKKDAYRGFFDLPEYKKLMPNKVEWSTQGSYLVNDLLDPTRKFSVAPSSKHGNGSRRTSVADRYHLRKGAANKR